MNTYKALFRAQAEIEFEVTLDAPNQTEGLVLAHDLAQQVSTAAMRVVNVFPGTSVNEAFELVKVNAPAVDASTNIAHKFKVQAYAERECLGDILFSAAADDLPTAKTIANSFTANHSGLAASVKVLDPADVDVYRVNAARGGWEVHTRHKSDANTANDVVETWLSSKMAAASRAGQLLGQYPDEVISIYDYTNRALGPIFWKQIG